MADRLTPFSKNHHAWRDANFRLIPSGAIAVFGAIMSNHYGSVRHGDIATRFVALIGVMLFVIFATAFVRVLSETVARLAAMQHLSIARAAALQFLLRLIAYIAIIITTLDLFGVPVGKLLLGGAFLGIILGVAAQQALANFFASIVLIIAHPITVGERVTLNSGALGGTYVGLIKDIGLTHTKLELDDGKLVLLPNVALLSGAAVVADKKAAKLSS